MDVCGLKGRDCIERNSIKTYNCSKTCVGIYADVVKMKIIWEREGGREKENILKFQGKEEELQQQLKDLIRMEVVKMKRKEGGPGEVSDAHCRVQKIQSKECELKIPL